MANGEQLRIRAADEADWPAILRAADQALPHAINENREWLRLRQTFNTSLLFRRHYVIELGDSGEVLAYGGIEETREPKKYRVFLVMAPDWLASLAQMLYDRLVEGMKEAPLWVREEADDPVLGFFRQQGFQQTAQFTLINGKEIVVLERYPYSPD